MGRGVETEDILSKTFASLKKTRVDGRLISEDQVHDVWGSLGQYVAELLVQGKSVQIAKFGTFCPIEESPLRKKDPLVQSTLSLSADFLKGPGLRQRQAGLPRVKNSTKLNFVGLSRYSQLSKDLCRKVVDGVIWNLSFALTKNSAYVSLHFPSLGEFECKKRICEFHFGELDVESSDEGSSSAGNDSEEQGSYNSSEEEEDYEDEDLQDLRPAKEILQARKSNRRVIPPSIDRLREKLKQRGGANGIHSLGRTLKIMDDSGDGSLDKDELKYGLLDFGIKLNSAELQEMFDYFDRDRSGKISFDEFLVGLRGPMSKRRLNLIKLAFKKLDGTGDGVITVDDLELYYNADYDPDVLAGRRTPADALRTLLKQFDTIEEDGIVTLEEFEEYYKNVSASIDKDDYFELMMRNAWHISGGKGQYANTTCRRVLVTHEDGSTSVEEIKDDLFVDKDDQTEMKRRLKKSGINAKGSLGLYHASEDTKKSKKTRNFNKKKTQVEENPFANAPYAGDESFAMEDAEEEAVKKTDPIAKLGKLLKERRLSVDDFLLKIGANRVFGSASIDVRAFIRGLTRFDTSITKSEAEEIARIADADQNGSVDVSELCAHIKGASAVDRIKQCLKSRGGMNGIASISRTLRMMDDNGDRSLDRRELTEGFQTFGVKLSSTDVQDIFAHFDKDKSGRISLDEFLIGLRGDMPESRMVFVNEAFRRLDCTGDGLITVEDLESVYDVSQHPEFIAGKKSKAQVLREFLDNFDEGDKDGIVTKDEFVDYYKGVSASIDRDDYFELMMRNAWHISGGRGQSANTTCRRVLVTDKNGKQSVKEVKDDLFVDTDDREVVRKRLNLAMGAKIDYNYSTEATEKPKRSKPKVLSSSLNRRKKPAAVKIGPSKVTTAWGSNFDTDNGGDESIPFYDDESTVNAPRASANVRSPRRSSKKKSKKSSSAKAITHSKKTSYLDRQRKEPEILVRFRNKVVRRGGTNGIHTLGRVLKIMDSSGDKSLDRSELKFGLQDYGIECTPNECEELFKYLDRDDSGKISFDEFLCGLRGPISKRRVDLIMIAFGRLDRTGDGVVTIEDLEMTYDPSFHPEVKSGKLSKADALREFLTQFDTIDQDGIVTDEEFIEYYKNVSASIDSDDYFELMMRNAWHISGGKGACANTTNRRVLVTDRNGRQSVQAVEDDLWVDKDDEAEMKRRLKKQGVDVQGKLGMHYASDNTKKPKATRSTNILAWEDEADKRGMSIDQLDKKIKNSRERERKIRAGAASRLQAIARSKKAQRTVSIQRKKVRKGSMAEEERKKEKLLESRKLRRPASSSWY